MVKSRVTCRNYAIVTHPPWVTSMRTSTPWRVIMVHLMLTVPPSFNKNWHKTPRHYVTMRIKFRKCKNKWWKRRNKEGSQNSKRRNRKHKEGKTANNSVLCKKLLRSRSRFRKRPIILMTNSKNIPAPISRYLVPEPPILRLVFLTPNEALTIHYKQMTLKIHITRLEHVWFLV